MSAFRGGNGAEEKEPACFVCSNPLPLTMCQQAVTVEGEEYVIRKLRMTNAKYHSLPEFHGF